MEKELRRRLVPQPKYCGTVAAALPAAPAAIALVHMQVL
jgi:hypothetical protein